MKQHLYRITVEHLRDASGHALDDASPLVFEARNHDDIQQVVAKVLGKQLFEPQTATAFAVGLKLFSEVLLEHRKDELFADLAPHLGAFMKKLKSRPSPP
ncbi:DUF3861 domain-containing protein [Pseudoxanthomonas dokdonensis]|uniref:DUF3861 domain-containing protein n=1 Tax=Pseudoxanthomonas dokdonensis TaxID=344882 RepID=A0A0R0CLU4_9GAMM|nr:DUF3861 domain-containing protein [Pseudoxanthomonas dokdonensis]KRG70512.1 hypothetical protein ABB29_05380 [Pseudoxanthomonas dokdonensis]